MISQSVFFCNNPLDKNVYFGCHCNSKCEDEKRILHKVDMSPLSILACDVNGDGELSSGDISRLNAAILNKVKLSW